MPRIVLAMRLQRKGLVLTLLIDGINGQSLRCELASGFVFLRAAPDPRRTNKNRKDERGSHQYREKGEGLIVVSIHLAQVSEQIGAEKRGERPREHHQSKDGADIAGAEIVRGKRGGNAIRATIAHHKNESNGCENW